MTEQKHTPTPWQILLDTETGLDAIAQIDGSVLAEITRWAQPKDAAFIVKAVNNYEKLIDALKSLEAVIEKLLIHTQDIEAFPNVIWEYAAKKQAHTKALLTELDGE